MTMARSFDQHIQACIIDATEIINGFYMAMRDNYFRTGRHGDEEGKGRH